jgi:hypothetical protein
MHGVFAITAGGDCRSVGNVNAVLAAVENNPSFFEVAFHGCSVKMH